MVKRLSAISVVLAVVLGMAAIPATAAMGGLTAPSNHKPIHPECIRYLKHGKFHKCRRHIGVGPGHPVRKPKPIGVGPGHPVGKPKPIHEPGLPCLYVQNVPCGPIGGLPINDSPCAYEACEESKVEPLEAKEVEVFEAVGFKEASRIYGCAGIYGTDFGREGDEYSITFLAKYGSFESKVTGGFKNKYEPSPTFCDRYVKPCPAKMPADGYDEVWVLVLDRTKHTSAESERVKFNIEEPENIRYPVG